MTIAILTMIYNEEKSLKEWIKFHKEVHDIDRFMFYLDYPDDNSKGLLDSMMNKYNIEYLYTDFNQKNYRLERLNHQVVERQKRSFTNGMKYLKDKVDWVAVMDVDEFIVPNENRRLKAVLVDIESSLYIPSYFFKPPVDIDKNIRDWDFHRISDLERIRIGTATTGKSVIKTEKYNGEMVGPHYVECEAFYKNRVDSIDLKLHHFKSIASPHSSKASFEVFDDSILKFI